VDGSQKQSPPSAADGTGRHGHRLFLILALARSLEALGEPPRHWSRCRHGMGSTDPCAPPTLPVDRSVEVATLRTAAVNRAGNRRLESADSATVFAHASNLGYKAG